jgi:hypothetical protein
MSIADLKTRLRDVPGIETLTMQMLAGRQNYSLNGRLISLDAAASDVDVETAIRAAIASPAIAQMPAGTPISPAASIAQATTPTPPATVSATTSATAGHPASGAHTVKEVLQEHARGMAELQATTLELLRATLTNQRQTVSGAMSGVVDKVNRQTEDYLSIMGQFTNDLGM